MPVLRVDLPAELTDEHLRAVGQYLEDERGLSRRQWACVLDAMDMLRTATLTDSERTRDFASLYGALVDAVYADAFIEQLLGVTDPTVQSEPIRAAMTRRIVQDLRHRGLSDPDVAETQLLVVFCLFWWQSFTKGYAFEAEIFRDLAACGIESVFRNSVDVPADVASGAP